MAASTFSSALPVLAGLALAGCAAYGPGAVQTGQTAQQVAASMGEPTGRHALPQGGTRLEYARGPMGKHTYMVDLGADGRVTGWQQVLTEPNLFAQAQPGVPVDTLLRELGHPSERRHGGWQGGEVWSYRYDAWGCLWFQVSVVGGQVKDAAQGIDPACDAGGNDKSE
ncbi:hypothetical protein V4F39_05170 [Aquincola sp. MAHUQ-54]|uniref:Lipoprotein n=1 Tax=Aquincola agrisoli TaxID=3119538 RepID=A0AAW9QD09_9BURK